MRMIREIFFRGFCVEDDEWHYGNLNMNIRHGKLLCIITEMDDLNKYYYVDELSVGQFTGFVDKNGFNIFEGDILKDHKGKMRAVRFYVDRWMACGNTHRTDKELSTSCIKCEIIGKLYHNSDFFFNRKIKTLKKIKK